MSLAYSPYESNSELDSANNYNNQKPNQKQQVVQQSQSQESKRYALNKTMKKMPKQIPSGSIDNSKVNSVLQKIHSMAYDNDSDEEEDNYEYSGYGYGSVEGFNPPEKPISAGVLRTHDANSQPNPNPNPNPNLNSNTFSQTQGVGIPDSDLDLDVTHSFQKNYPNKTTAMEYYKKFIPNFNSKKIEGYEGYASVSSDDILRKLNYMIHLLEEQKDEKTGNVTEEVVLYCFLGVFIIFVVDSFARVGKYVR
jgi:hypothetical protein